MTWNEKLHKYLKEKKISQKEAGVLLSVSPSMMSRILSGRDGINQEFVKNMIIAFPDIDLKSIFTESVDEYKVAGNANGASEEFEKINIDAELAEIEQKIATIRKHLAQ